MSQRDDPQLRIRIPQQLKDELEKRAAFGPSSGGAMFSSKERLAKALKDNRSSYTISRDGHVSLNLDAAEVVKAIATQIEKLADIEQETGTRG